MLERGFLGVLGAACILASAAFYTQGENLVGSILAVVGAILLAVGLRGQEDGSK